MDLMPYDVVVVGSGPGGYSAAIRASQYGLKTALVEKDPKLGGTCLHVGCIPTKALLHAASLWEEIQHSSDHGIECGAPQLDLAKLIARKNSVVSKHAKGIEFLMKKNKVDWIQGRGKLLGAGEVLVETASGPRRLEALNIIVATGSEARMLPGLAPDPVTILTNVEILNLEHLPKSLAIIGAGAVGVEFASIFHRFGTKVTLFEMLPRIVPLEDEDISKELLRVFKKSGIRVETGARVEEVEKTDSGVRLRVTPSGGKTESFEAEKLLVAVGRKPNTEGIGLEDLRVETDRGYIRTGQYMQTRELGVYAIGDVVAGSPQLAHVATAEGLVAAAHIAGRPVKPVNYRRVPGATYTEPEIGSVGLTEAEARATGRAVRVGKFPFLANSKATILGRHDGFVKVVADERYGEILGVHIIGPHATDLIAEAVAAMEAEATVETLMSTIHPHPTVSEAVGEAFNAVYGLAINA
ncbi:MAG: dihydrolipoyl dehydrogenase [Bryobacteraceae bacterium]